MPPKPASANKPAPKKHVAVRLDPATDARVEALRPRFAIPGRDPTRSDVLRALIILGLEAEQKRAAT